MDIHAVRRANLQLLQADYRAKGLTQEQLARDVGSSRAYISQLVSGSRDPGRAFCKRLEERLRLPSGWMEVLQDSPDRKRSVTPEQIALLRSYALPGDGSTPPLLMERGWAGRFGIDPDDLRTMAVDGDAMSPLVNSGDIAVYLPVGTVAGAGLYVVQMHGVMGVRRILPEPDGALEIACQNVDYPPIRISSTQRSVVIVGRVLWVVKKVF